MDFCYLLNGLISLVGKDIFRKVSFVAVQLIYFRKLMLNNISHGLLYLDAKGQAWATSLADGKIIYWVEPDLTTSACCCELSTLPYKFKDSCSKRKNPLQGPGLLELVCFQPKYCMNNCGAMFPILYWCYSCITLTPFTLQLFLRK